MGLLLVGKRPKEIVSYNMSRIRSEGTRLEAKLEEILKTISHKYSKHPKLFGKPDFVYSDLKIAIFADSDFWHGFNWNAKKLEIKTNKEFWINKIERNISRDKEVTAKLEEEGWNVIRLWGHDILRHPNKCQNIIERVVRTAQSKTEKPNYKLEGNDCKSTP
jgi:DNA mismatch endonuclease (patch repair protein)